MDEEKLIRRIEGMTPAAFGRLLIRLPEATNQIPTEVSHLERVAALFRYLRSSTGPGVKRLTELVNELFPEKVIIGSVREEDLQKDYSSTGIVPPVPNPQGDLCLNIPTVVPEEIHTAVSAHLLGLGITNYQEVSTQEAIRLNMQMISRKKAADQFSNSCLGGRHAAIRAADVTVENLKTACMLSKSKVDGLSKLTLPYSSNVWHGQPYQESVQTVASAIRSLHAACPAVCVAALCVMRRIAHRLRQYGCILDIDLQDINSVDLAGRVARRDWDIVIVADYPLVLSPNSLLARYQRILPIHTVQQYLLQKRSTDKPRPVRRVFACPGSSSELQFRLQRARNWQLIEFDITSVKEVAAELDEGDCVILWNPLASYLMDSGKLKPVKGGRFDFTISLYAERRWCHQSSRLQLLGLCELFVSEWNSCSRNPQVTWQQVEGDAMFLRQFARAYGLAGLVELN